MLLSCPTFYYSNYSHYRVTLETPLCTRGAHSLVWLTLEMIAHLNKAAVAAIPAWCAGRTRGFYDIALGGGLTPTQVIITLINCSSYILIKSTRRDEWGWSNLPDFLQPHVGKLNRMAGRKHFQWFLQDCETWISNMIRLAGKRTFLWREKTQISLCIAYCTCAIYRHFEVRTMILHFNKWIGGKLSLSSDKRIYNTFNYRLTLFDTGLELRSNLLEIVVSCGVQVWFHLI